MSSVSNIARVRKNIPSEPGRMRLEMSSGWAAFGVSVAVLLAYWPALHGGFLWNDSDYVTKPALRSLAGLGRIWCEVGATEQYYPLLHSAFWLQHWLWGDAPLGYHLVNVMLHTATAVLFALVLRRLAVPGAWLAAVIFALHPVHVESVAWITEQKNTLSTLLFLAATFAYLRFEGNRTPARWSLATVFFIGALLSKTMTATLPAVLLVVCWWRNGRIHWRRDVRPLLPWFALAIGAALLASWVEREFLRAQGGAFELTLAERVLVAGRAPWFYLGKLIWPAELIFIYPRWEVNAASIAQWLYPLGGVAVLTGLWWLRARGRAPLAVVLLFLGMLFPVLGFVNLYGALYSFVWDHWQYLPNLALIAAGAAGGVRLLARAGTPWLWPGRIAATAIVALLGFRSWQQSHDYADVVTLYQVTIARNPDAWMAHYNLGQIRQQEGRLDEARQHFVEALRVDPELPDAHLALGTVLRELDRSDEAQRHLEAAWRLAPESIEVLNSLGVMHASLGRFEQAVSWYERALALEPNFAEAHVNLGLAYRRMGRLVAAITHLEEAVKLRPELADAHNSLANVLQYVDRGEDAIRHYREALRLDPDFALAHYNLAVVLLDLRRPDEARPHYHRARELLPALPELPLR